MSKSRKKLTQGNSSCRPDICVAHIVTDRLEVIHWNSALVHDDVIMGSPGGTLNRLMGIQVYSNVSKASCASSLMDTYRNRTRPGP